MRTDTGKVLANVRQAGTEDLLDRATVYRDGMEPDALHLIDRELIERGVTPEEIAEHARRRKETMLADPDGWPVKCSLCDRPAVARPWRWHRLWGKLPLFPRRTPLCAEHAPDRAP